ncbi:hypothetical protein [Bacillus sp. NEB1478]|uniref:hypothetical protein n=1 Tax=Bacillus sp. NEB1478 TaxID=3073816 RepID=UPI0028736BAE|nr:hypothetical protein [Bacillus sp. NEB1478]WNB93414.1 hypothetical protein RGB74_07020 [Bacillus sp. NEB1478]
MNYIQKIRNFILMKEKENQYYRLILLSKVNEKIDGNKDSTNRSLIRFLEKSGGMNTKTFNGLLEAIEDLESKRVLSKILFSEINYTEILTVTDISKELKKHLADEHIVTKVRVLFRTTVKFCENPNSTEFMENMNKLIDFLEIKKDG